MNVNIRVPELRDIDSLAIEANNREVCEFMIDFSYPYNKEQGIAFLKYAISWFQSQTACHFVIDYWWKAIGIIGWDINEGDSIEIGYRIWRAYRWRGFVAIAMLHMIKFLKQVHPKIKYLLAKCNTQNIRSKNFLIKNWFQKIKQKANMIYFSYAINV